MINLSKHITQRLSLIILIMGMVMIFTLQTNAQRDYELFGAVDGETTMLYWDCRTWPSDMKGFVIRRAEAGGDQWITLTHEPIVPSMDPETDFRSRGLTTEEIEALQKVFQTMRSEGKLSIMTSEELRSVLIQNNGPGSGDRIRMKSDYNLSLILGFAFVDQTVVTGTAYDYALHAAYLDGTISTRPLDTFRLGMQPFEEPDVDFFLASGGIQLTWRMSVQEIREGAILGFLIARKEPGPRAWMVLSDQPISYASTDNDTVMFRFQDNTAVHDQDYLFELTPVNMFQQEGEPFQVLFTANQYKVLLPPQIKMVALHEEADMAVYWAIPEADSMLIRNFVLETTQDPGQWEPPLAVDTISPDARWFVDKRPKRYGEVYFYRLKAIGRYGQESVSSTETFYFMGLIRPPAVEGLKWSLVRNNNDTYVHLRWSPKQASDTITRGYAIWSDELIPDSLLQLSNLPLITENNYLYPITTQGGRNYRFHVTGMNTQGAPGEPAEASLVIGTLRMPRVYQTTLERVADGNLLIQWEYPAIADLEGFRILLNNKEVAGEKLVQPDMRSFLMELPNTMPKEGITVVIVAVGSIAESEPGMPQRLYLPNYKKRQMLPPSTIWHEIVPGGIQLCWTPPSVDLGQVKGYALFADYSTPGILQRLNTIPVLTSTEYLITNEIDIRETMTLGVAAIHNDGTVGRIREMVISASKENSPTNIQKQQ